MPAFKLLGVNMKAVVFLHAGESGLVYKAYINTALGKELVAVKTGKGMLTIVRRKDVSLLSLLYSYSSDLHI